MKKVLLFAAFNFGLLTLTCFGQNKYIDSVLILLKKDISDTSKVNHLYLLAGEYCSIGFYDNALHYANAALQLARQLLEGSPNKIGAELQGIKKQIANLYNIIGNVYANQGDYPKSLNYYSKALKIAEELDDKNRIAALLGNTGTVYDEQGNYPKALDYYFKALKMGEELLNRTETAKNLNNIGIVYHGQEDYQKALDYYSKALKIVEELGDKNQIASLLGNIGSIYYAKKDNTQALDYYFKSLKTCEQEGDKNVIVNNFGNIGSIYVEQKDYQKALVYFFKAFKMDEESGNKEGVSVGLRSIGSVYTSLKKYNEAYIYIYRALALSDSIGAKNDLKDCYNDLSNLYEKSNMPLPDSIGGKLLNMEQMRLRSMYYYKKSIAIRDTLFSEENKKQLVRKEMNYEFDKKEAITKAENEKQYEIAEEKNRRQKIVSLSVGCGLILVLLFAGFVFRSLRVTRKQKKIIEIKKTETEQQKKIIEEKNKDITDSIRYAKRIQDALMGEQGHVSMNLPEHFILFMPKDIVSGDFHWGAEKQGHWYFAAVDCTGHGVPGAVMSMLGISFLNDIVASEKLFSPAEVLNHLRDKIVKELRQTGEAGGSKDGMDISLCRLNLKTNELQWAGAYNPLNFFRNGQLEELKADKQPIGYHPENRPFTNHQIQLQKGDSIYLYSDGYADQFGGSKGKKFKYKQLEDLLITNYHLPLKDQKEILKERFTEWKGSLEQVDDVCVFGVRV